ncbi:amidase [Embleya sp. NBC_00888]|uniref:amidase n=1 Tax=Embleya sp. NBC_00888 TaxID=2975960 RepID=UPI0038693BBC|nr:amidase [Embleya sp. NBC_00888]
MTSPPTPGREPGTPALRRQRLAHGGIAGLAAAVRAGDIDHDEPSRAALARIARLDGELHSFTQIFPAPHAPGRRRGSLAGLPVAVKDNIDVAGRVTSLGLPLGVRPRADADARAVTRLRDAGAVIVGKTNLPELASSAITHNLHYGHARNPWDRERTAGGSSGGSGSAVAADMVVAALGTDTAGSVLVPAALNGVCGLRPTPGRIDTTGVTPLSPSLDTVGILAWEPADVHHVFTVLDEKRPAADSVPDPSTGLRIGLLTGWFRDADRVVLDVLDTITDRLARLGVDLRPAELPSAERVLDQARIIYAAEAAASLAVLLDPGVRYAATVEKRRSADAVPAPDVLSRARSFRASWRTEVSAAFAHVDLLLCPTTPITAPRIDTADEQTISALLRFTYPFCLAGTPAISLPGAAGRGLPVGITLAAPPGHDHRLLTAATTYRNSGLFEPVPPPVSVR